MKILSIRISQPEELSFNGRKITTSINKKEIPGPVKIHRLGLEGDTQSDLRVHGGVDKAVYAFSYDAYPWWQQKRPQTSFPYGAFGENLTLETLDEDQTRIGDRYRLGMALLEVSEPRFPCLKLGFKYQDMDILNEFNESLRPGVYFRVLEEGVINYGDVLTKIHTEAESISIRELFLLKNKPSDFSSDFIQKVIQMDIMTEAWKTRLRRFL